MMAQCREKTDENELELEKKTSSRRSHYTHALIKKFFFSLRGRMAWSVWLFGEEEGRFAFNAN